MFRNFKEESDGQKLAFQLEGVSLSLANALRRTCLVEVPIVGIDRDSISFRIEDNNINTSSFHDEFLIHRISYARLKIDPSEIKDFSLKICDPRSNDLPLTNQTDDIVDITTNDIIVEKNQIRIHASDVFLGRDLLARLKPNQQLKADLSLNIRAVRSPGIVPKYHYMPCRVHFSYANPKHDTKKIMTPDDELNYHGCENKTPKAFVFEIHGFGSPQYPTSKIFLDAIDVLYKKIENVLAYFKDESDVKFDDISRISDERWENAINYKIKNEDHTLGHLLAEACRKKLCEMGHSTKNFVAYQKTHPLEPMLSLDIRIDPKFSQKFTADDVLNRGCHQILEDIITCKKSFELMLRKRV